MEAFEALVHSLGECSVTYVGKEHLRQLTIWADELHATAHIEICLEDDSWAAREHAIDKMIEIRQMFLDDISIEYAFSGGDYCYDQAPAEEPEFSFAA